MNHKIVKLNNNDYSIFNIKKSTPVIIDNIDYEYIKKLNKKWYLNDNGFVYCHHISKNGDKIDIYMHEIIMARKTDNPEKIPIVHINRIGIDNRRDNLMYDTIDKEINKNTSKKARIIKLPRSSGIKPNEIPSFIWYLKPDSTHGERFMIHLDNISWKSTSASDKSLRFKLEQSKKYLRDLQKTRPDLFNKYSMNGGYNKEGKELVDSFYKILNEAGFKKIKKIETDYNKDYLKINKNGLTDDEVKLLDN